MSKADRSTGKVIPLRRRVTDSPIGNTLELGQLLSKSETGEILDFILEKAVQNLNAEGGSIYFIQDLKQESYGGALPKYQKVLRFYRSMNKKLNSTMLHSEYIGIDTKSIAGYVAMMGQAVRIKDCYHLPPDSPFSFNTDFDRAIGYKTISILSVPIKAANGTVIGVVQLVNKLKNKKGLKKLEILPFTKQDEQLVDALASQTGIALENAKLSSDIANLFESFVKASVSAIEARDPSTSGHSDRVAVMTVRLAQVVDQISYGPFANIKYTPQQLQEIRYASLLHDFGKIGVRENLLLKAKKLFPHELETIILRLETIKAKHESRNWRMVAEQMHSHLNVPSGNIIENHEKLFFKTQWKVDQYNQHVERVKAQIFKANESQVMDGDFDIQSLMKVIHDISANIGQIVLTEDENRRLSIGRGTLSNEERRQIESHVSFTYQFLSQIAWTPNLSSVADIAHSHHEKLDGTGYPQGLRSDQIPLQSRMMTVSDIYDALTAMDRPYKKSVTNERAVEILNYEADQGKIDKDLVKIFVEAEVYKQALNISKTKRSA